MSDRYLWDRSGPRDPDVEKLERALSSLAHDGRPLEMPESGPEVVTLPMRPRPRIVPMRGWLLAAAALIVVAGIATWRATRPVGPSWAVEWLSGNGSRPDRLTVGRTLATGAGERARVQVDGAGEVTVEPESRVRLVRASAEEQRMALDRGVLRALIFAPPRQFVVDTPSAAAVDLGCVYTLEVADDGASTVTVESGWVSFERDGRETFIPAGARCVTRRGQELGLPHFLDADPAFVAALDRATKDSDALAAVLAAARADDALTLWHLLARTRGDVRATVFDRLAALVPPPAGVTRDGVLAADGAMLDLYWNALGLGDAEWWRVWAQDPPAGRG